MTYFSEDITARFFCRVDIGDDCWIWNHSKTKDGYGQFHHGKYNTQSAHRYSKEIELGYKLPRNMDASHTCVNRDCVNPAHIVVETRKKNIGRSSRVQNPDQGVTFRKDCNRWRAYRYLTNGKQVHLGYYNTRDEALRAVADHP